MTCVYLDVSALPAPEPLEAAIEAIQVLEEGNYLHFHHRQYPRLLFEQLHRAGCEFDVRLGAGRYCEVLISKKGDVQAASAAMDVASDSLPWIEQES